jgi:diguanylate cyclase (GGDEF)-like protein
VGVAGEKNTEFTAAIPDSEQVLLLSLLLVLQQNNTALQKLSHYDALTQLPNRLQYEEDLKREFARIVRFKRKLALLYIDVDFFRKVNDGLGHDVGDLLLQEVARRLKSAIRIEDFIARIGGDQFAAILTEISNPHDAGVVAHRIVEMMNQPFIINGRSVIASVSIGIACYPDSGRDASELNKNANIALSGAKAMGRRHYQFFTSDLHEQHAKRLEIESELHFALEKNQFFLVYQPRFNLQTQKMVGMEVLLRWAHPERGTIPPNDFIPIAEETGLIIPIGNWVLKTACNQYALWQQKYKGFDAVIAVNVSPLQFQQASFIPFVTKTVQEAGITPELLELEITESAVVGFLGKIENNLFQLRDFGVQFSIDDFGTGYSSFTRLKELPIQAIKIDRSFVSDIDVKMAGNIIIKSTLVLAKGMGLNVIAEGVETEEQKLFLERNNCPQAQGYYYSRPLTVEQMEAFIKTHLNESVV